MIHMILFLVLSCVRFDPSLSALMYKLIEIRK